MTSGPPFSHRLVVGTFAVFAGAYVVWRTGKDFEFVKFEPYSEEEVERRKREKVPFSIRQLDSRTLDYTPEAKKRLKEYLAQQSNDNGSNSQK